MVMHVQVHHESSFFSLDDSINVILVERDDRDEESFEVEVQDISSASWTISAARDTSTTCRENVSADNTRHTVNTQTSIFDLTKEEDEEDDDDDDEASVLFQDLRESNPCRLQEDALETSRGHEKQDQVDKPKLCKRTTSSSSSTSSPGLLARFSADGFFDTLCSASTTVVNESTSSRSSRRPRASCSSTSLSCMSMPCTSSKQVAQSHGDDQQEETSSQHSRTSHTAPMPTTVDLIPATPSEDRLRVETDVWNLLGCASPPNVMELESIWNLTTTAAVTPCPSSRRPLKDRGVSKKRPSRASLKDRMQRIQRLRQDRWSGATRHGVTLSQHGPFSPSLSLRAVSMDQLDAKDYSGWRDSPMGIIDLSSASLANAMGLSSFNPTNNGSALTPGSDPGSDAGMASLTADGYDSDPEFGGSNHGARHDDDEGAPHSSRSAAGSGFPAEEDLSREEQVLASQPHHDHMPRVATKIDQVAIIDSEEQDFIIYQTVQQTLNSTWTLTWHPNEKNVKEFNIPPKPLMINIWMERGTVITHSGVVIEPMFMWRDAYQSHYLLQQRKRLNPTCQKPWSMRLLNTCRIAPACGQTLDKARYPLARKANCLVVKTCQGQEFLLEANSATQMELICERWKITVARFASLAVTEDIDAIAQEFFHPTLSSQTLTVQNHNDRSMVSSSSSEDSSSSSSTSRASPSTSSSLQSTPRMANPTVTQQTVPVTGTTTGGRRWSDI